ncbi:MAG TPA: abortive infection system antitoxin AbiGi family protein, partial [Bacteroidales bacterium]|nr:abortive infection system antitoxin AbiGi family protein [Bacteroidales bacterium]
VCFTDLPSDQIANHIDQYGKYVIGLSKDWGIANGITPIRYIHHYTPDIYNNNFRFITDFIERYPQSKNDIIDLANDFLKQAGKNDFITSSDISNLPEKFNFLIMMYDQIIKDICSLVYTHFGLMRIYEERVMNVEKQKYEQKIYYNEREWRSLDTIGEKANLNFHAYDISGIYVTNKDEIKELITFFEKNKTKYEIDNMKSFKEKIKLINEL